MPYKRKEDRDAYDALRKEHVISLVREAKNIPCTDCDILYPFYIMQFDHVRDEKKFNLAKVGSYRAVSVKKVEDEIAKCEVVCANCHAARTYLRRQGLK